MRARVARFREDWAAAGEAIERAEQARARKAAAVAQRETRPDDTEGVVVANAATIAGNVANHIVQQ
jgi:hypothetical protein